MSRRVQRAALARTQNGRERRRAPVDTVAPETTRDEESRVLACTSQHFFTSLIFDSHMFYPFSPPQATRERLPFRPLFAVFCALFAFFPLFI